MSRRRLKDKQERANSEDEASKNPGWSSIFHHAAEIELVCCLTNPPSFKKK